MMERTLHLNLKKKWFDMIQAGEKKEEYREIGDYWDLRLGLSDWVEDPDRTHNFTTVTFSNGYAKDRPQMIVELKSIIEAEGKPEWGAVPGKKYFVLSLGALIADFECCGKN